MKGPEWRSSKIWWGCLRIDQASMLYKGGDWYSSSEWNHCFLHSGGGLHQKIWIWLWLIQPCSQLWSGIPGSNSTAGSMKWHATKPKATKESHFSACVCAARYPKKGVQREREIWYQCLHIAGLYCHNNQKKLRQNWLRSRGSCQWLPG